jgi:hypothetical protein
VCCTFNGNRGGDDDDDDGNDDGNDDDDDDGCDGWDDDGETVDIFCSNFDLFIPRQSCMESPQPQMSPDNNAEIIGIGVGVALAVVFVLSVATFLIFKFCVARESASAAGGADDVVFASARERETPSSSPYLDVPRQSMVDAGQQYHPMPKGSGAGAGEAEPGKPDSAYSDVPRQSHVDGAAYGDIGVAQTYAGGYMPMPMPMPTASPQQIVSVQSITSVAARHDLAASRSDTVRVRGVTVASASGALYGDVPNDL